MVRRHLCFPVRALTSRLTLLVVEMYILGVTEAKEAKGRWVAL